MEEIDKWAAEQCGVSRCDDGSWTKLDGVWLYGLGFDEWTIQDPRCREIVREHFKLTTDQYGKGWSSFPRINVDLAIETRGNGKTIAEAEINCIKAIRETQSDEM